MGQTLELGSRQLTSRQGGAVSCSAPSSSSMTGRAHNATGRRYDLTLQWHRQLACVTQLRDKARTRPDDRIRARDELRLGSEGGQGARPALAFCLLACLRSAGLEEVFLTLFRVDRPGATVRDGTERREQEAMIDDNDNDKV